MDFFSAVADPTQTIVHNDRLPDNAPGIDSFAEAIASRFGSGAILTARLTPITAAPPNSSMANMSLVPPSIPHSGPLAAPPGVPLQPILPSQFITLATQTIQDWIDDPATLILDIRPHVAHSTARVPRAVSLSVPSTLLKRPLFSLHRLAEMLPSANARARFSAWRSASRILVYDADSSSIPESSNIYGLLRKFKNDGFHGDLAWLKGGFQAVWRERHDIIDTEPLTPDAENDDDDDDDPTKSSQSLSQGNVLRTRHLPMAAFSFTSTTVSSTPSTNSITNPKRALLTRGTTFPSFPAPSQNPPQPAAFNPFFDAVRQNIELSQGITERIPLRLPRRVRHRIHELPFPWLREIARRAAKLGPQRYRRNIIDSSSSASDESEDDENATSVDVEEGKEALAMQFFKIEVAEQRRLMGIMEHHSKETTIIGTSHNDSRAFSMSNFPYSITAGVEKGAKNRYRHIWPFEHARVRLHQKQETDDDYVNASYVQPLGTNKRYIATQGPLPATFTDFWTLCWEQNVHVIVMLTREVEGSMVKCGSYWVDPEYGPLRLRLVSTSGEASPAEESSFFAARSVRQRRLSSSSYTHQYRSLPSHHRHRPRTNEIVRRVFELTHTGYPNSKPRKIVHLQYLEWSDMNVPDDPRGILGLIKEVEEAVKETASPGEEFASISMPGSQPNPAENEIDEKTGVAKHMLGNSRPVLLHCSAGVGRTGGFIAVDAVLDAIRREYRDNVVKDRQRQNKDRHAMDVDTVPSQFSMSIETDDAMAKEQGQGKEPSSTERNRDGALFNTSRLDVPIPIILPSSSNSNGNKSASSSAAVPAYNKQYPTTLPDPVAKPGPEESRADNAANNVSDASNLSTKITSDRGLTDSPLISDSSNFSSNSSLDLFSAYGFDKAPGTRVSSLETSISEGVRTDSSKSSPFNEIPLSKGTNALAPNEIEKLGGGNPTGPVLRDILAKTIPKTTDTSSVESSQQEAQFESRLDGNQGQTQTTSFFGEAQRRSPSSMSCGSSASGDRTSSIPPIVQFNLNLPTKKLPLAPRNSVNTGTVAESPNRPLALSLDKKAMTLPTGADRTHSIKDARHGDSGRLTSHVVSVSPTSQNDENGTESAYYKEPRPLHRLTTPPYLTSFEEPIFEVVQDMREQRMSLCQSLRQYVFVNAAVIEGALMVMDEEEERMDKERSRNELDTRVEEEKSSGHGDRKQREKSTDTSSDATKEGTGRSEMNINTAQAGWGITANFGGSGPGVGQAIAASPSTCYGTSITGETMSGIVTEASSPGFPFTPASAGDGGDENMDFFSRPKQVSQVLPGKIFPPAFPSLQRPQHSPKSDLSYGNRSVSPAEFMKDNSVLLSVEDSEGIRLRRPSTKRKQPSGDGEVGVRSKRAQNESLSRERMREREKERAEARTGDAHLYNSFTDLTSGLVR